MTHEVKVGSLWENRDGETVEVLAVHGDVAFVKIGAHAILCEIKNLIGHCTLCTPPRRCEGWVHVYDLRGRLCFGGSVYPSKACALAARDIGSCFSTIKIEYEEPQE